MKRILHALAALWPGRPKGEDRRREIEDRSWETEEMSRKAKERWKAEERRREHEGPWLPEARNGLLQHLNAMMRMGETVRELATRECTHVPSRESVNEQPNKSANQQIDESAPKKTDNQLPKRVIVSEREQPAESIGEPLPIAQVLARVYLRNAPCCTRGGALADPHIGESATKHESSIQPINTPAHHRSLVALTAFIFAVFMCLLSAQQASAQQAEPAAAAVIKPLQIGDTIPEYLWHLPLQVVNHPEGKETITLNDYRDRKVIVLDFWATWCKPCLESLNKLDKIRDSAFRNELAVIPVQAFDSERRAVAFIERNKWQRYSVVNDATLQPVAFSRYLTGFGTVWIAEGKFYAAPLYEGITAENIAWAVRGNPSRMDNQPDQAMPGNSN